MKIGIIGAPETGKSKLARALAKNYELKLVDNYVQKLQRETNLALGPWASYSELTMVAGHRLAAEEKVGQERITVGTMLDTLAYAAIKHDPVVDDITSTYKRVQGSLLGLSAFLEETWDYHLCFLLAYNKPAERSIWEQRLDASYPFVIESYGGNMIFQLDGSHTDRLKIATELIDFVRENPSEEKAKAPALA